MDVVCDSLASDGRGVCRAPGNAFVLFVPFAAPGETLRCRISRLHARFADATRLAQLAPPPAAAVAQPPCPYFGDCGGCAWQHLAYDTQLAAKAGHVSDAFRRIGRVALAPAAEALSADAPPALLPALGAPPHARLRYRNKVAFAVAPAAGGGVVIGLQREGRSAAAEGAAALVPLSACALQHPAGDGVLATARAAAARHPAAAARLRRITLRTAADASTAAAAAAGARVQMELGALPGAPRAAMAAFAADVAAAHPELVSVVLSEHEAPPPHSGPGGAANGSGGRRAAASAAAAAAAAAAASPARAVVLHGDEWLEMSLGGLRFRVSAAAFFQVNPACAELLLGAVRDAAALAPGEAVLDLFCGTGALGLCLVAGGTGGAGATAAAAGPLLRGWDVSATAVADAAANAALNGVPASRAAFKAADLGRGGLAAALRGPRVVVLDPARAGASPALVAELRASTAQRLVYVSCNAATQARDVAALCAPGGTGKPYRLRWVQPVDMFPQTPHVETVALLTRDA